MAQAEGLKMRAMRAFPYAGRELAKGDEFDAENSKHAELLSVIGHAKSLATTGAAERRGRSGYKRRDMRPETSVMESVLTQADEDA